MAKTDTATPDTAAIVFAIKELAQLIRGTAHVLSRTHPAPVANELADLVERKLRTALAPLGVE